MVTTVMETERVRLRHMTMDDLASLSLIFQDPIAMNYYPSTKNKEESIRWITWNINNYKKFHVGIWIVEKKETCSFLGQCGLVPQKVDGEVQMEIGYSFVRNEWGKGYATEAAIACKDYGFDTLHVPKLISLIDPDNQPSINVARKVGMTYNKTISKWGKEIDVYSIDNKSQ